jgi:type IV secretory pathway VirB10-like protein
MADLVRSTLRLRPDRIIVGEVRGGEALDMLKAWNTGHPGGIATVHANSARSALYRIEQLVQEAVVTVPRRLIAEAIDIIVFISGRGLQRRVSEIARVRGVSLDPVLMRADWLSAYDFATQRGSQFLGEYAAPEGRMSEDNIATPPAPKVDPETLAIRSRPPRAIRFKRGVIIAIAAIGSVSLIAVTWMALKPQVFRRVAEQELAQPNFRSSTDALNGLPASYDTVPKLGPPLPGDLGRPILEHQRAIATEAGVGDGQVLAQAEAAEHERQFAELKAARQSGLLVQSGRQAIPVGESAAAGAPAAAAPVDPARVALDPGNDPNAQGRKAAFVGVLDPRGDINPHVLTAAVSPYTLSAGSVIAASLITGLRSDLPGIVTAQVTEQVYDSVTGRILLIPQGSRLIGSYDSVVAFGQKRALIVWQRIMLPDGSSLRIDNVPASDAAGYAGLQDKVDFHTWALLKGVVISTLLGVGSQLALSGDSDLVQAIRQSTQDSVSRAGDQITSRNLNIQPTITIRPGAPVRLVVHKDLILAPWKG